MGAAIVFVPIHHTMDRNLIAPLVLLLNLLPAAASAQQGWEPRHSFPGSSRWGAASFSIGDKGYVVGGRDSLANDLSETWSYGRAGDHWVERAGLPVGKERRLASGWAIGNYGYVSCGEYNSGNKRNDLWRYDPASNNWAQLASLPGLPRYGAYAFTVGGIAYIGGGNNAAPGGPYLQDLWSYDPANNQWAQVSGLPGQGRYGATAFTLGDTAYVVGGHMDDQTMGTELWRYVPATDTWTLMTPLPASGRAYAMTWSLAQGGMVAGGKGDVAISDAWLYRPNDDSWAYAPPYAGAAGWNACTFTIADSLFAGLGQAAGTPCHDLWVLGSEEVTQVEPVQATANALSIEPTVSAPGGVLRMKGPAPALRGIKRVELFDMTGRATYAQLEADKLILPAGAGTGRYIVDVMLADGSRRDIPITVVE